MTRTDFVSHREVHPEWGMEKCWIDPACLGFVCDDSKFAKFASRQKCLSQQIGILRLPSGIFWGTPGATFWHVGKAATETVWGTLSGTFWTIDEALPGTVGGTLKTSFSNEKKAPAVTV